MNPNPSSVRSAITHALSPSPFRLLATAALGACLLATTPRVLAQTAPAASSDDARTLRTVTVEETADDGTTEGTGSLTTGGPVVSATGLDLTLRETPQSVTVITRERLDQQNLASLTDVAEQVPGLFYSDTGTSIGGRTEIYARGYAVDSFQVDGVNLPWEFMSESERYGHGSLDTAIYDSISVVRGATGLLSGAGEPSASIALQRKRPTAEWQGTVVGTVGQWNQYRLMADVGGPLTASGRLRGRLVGAYDGGDTWVDRYSNDRTIFYGALETDITANTLATLSLEHGTANSKGAPWASAYGNYPFFEDGITPMPDSRSASMAADWAYLDSERQAVTFGLQHHFAAGWRAKLTYGYGRFESDMRRGMVSSVPQDGTPTEARVLDLAYQYDTHIVDARVDGRYSLFGREHDLVVGFNFFTNDQALPVAYYGDHPDLAYWNGTRLVYDDLDWDSLVGLPGDTKVEQSGAYLATRLRAGERLAVILGGRLTNWKTLSSDRDPFFVWDDREYQNEFTPYAGLVFTVNRALSAYASFTEIFNPQYSQDVDGNLLDPEAGRNYEAGLKGEWLEGRLNASAAVFEARRDNLAVEDGTNTTPDGEQAYRSEDHTKGRGWELEVAGEILPRWQLQGGYSRFRNESSEGVTLDTTQPVHQFKLFTSYGLTAVPGLTLGGSVRWQSRTVADTAFIVGDPAAYRTGQYAIASAHADYAWTPKLGFSLRVDNVFDQRSRTSNYYYSYEAPVNAALTVRAKF